MPHVRLMGLVLCITTVFLGLAAAATSTTVIRFKQPGQASLSPPPTPDAPPQDPAGTDNLPPVDAEPLQFVSIPIFFPLVAAGITGLALWFIPAAVPAQSSRGKRSRSRRRK